MTYLAENPIGAPMTLSTTDVARMLPQTRQTSCYPREVVERNVV